MSKGSSFSTGNSKASRHVLGIPKECWCGASIISKLSKSEANPYRRYFRCAQAANQKLAEDNHVFKWCDEAMINEIDSLTASTGRLQNELRVMSSYMEDQEAIARAKVEDELIERFEEAVKDAKRRMQALSIGVVVICLVGFGVMKWVV